MKAAQTKFVNNVSPFTGKKKPIAQKVEADIKTVSICDDKYAPERAKVVGKYDKTFGAMEFGQAVKCQGGDALKIAAAMRKWGKTSAKKIVVRATSNYKNTGTGRVWMLRG